MHLLGALQASCAASLIFCTGCAGQASWFQTPNERAASLLSDNRFELLAKSPHTLAALQSTSGSPKKLTVFIEGDGASWPKPALPPADPTPGNPLALLLAVAHTNMPASSGEAVAYLGRPCQYLQAADLTTCPVGWWTLGRFGEVPVNLMNARLDELKARAPNAALRLVGYSGGGAVAALLAAQRGDVTCLVTVAAPLDIDAWTRAKNVSALIESLNPLGVAAKLHQLPMTHFSGDRDNVVPLGVNQQFLHRAQTSDKIKVGFDHDMPWLKAWPSLAAESCLTR